MAEKAKKIAVLTKTRAVMTGSRIGEQFAEYATADPDSVDGVERHLLLVRNGLFVEMGQPDTITVTIEVGDRINCCCQHGAE